MKYLWDETPLTEGHADSHLTRMAMNEYLNKRAEEGWTLKQIVPISFDRDGGTRMLVYFGVYCLWERP